MKYKVLAIIFFTCITSACSSLSTQEVQTLSAEALYYKGIQNLAGHNIPKNEAKALQYFKAASDKGYAAADNAIAVMYDEGISVKKDQLTALKYYEKAADRHDLSAQYNLAAYYYENQPDHPKLQYYLKQSIANNDSDALNLQARIQMQNGQLTEAHQSLRQSAQQRNPQALFYLYLMHKNGQGVPKNNRKAMNYLQQSAELNQSDALFTLGTMYLQGEGVQKNSDKAFKLLEKATQLGHTKASVNLAIMYQKGDGIQQDIAKAIQLLQLAATQGDPQAIQALATIK